MQITIFSTTTCPYCKILKDYLAQKGVSFSEKLVDQNDEAKEEMLKESGGFLGVPFILINNDDGTKDTVLGFDKGKLNELLRLQ